MDLARRVLADELMDSPSLPALQVQRALRGLDRLNALSCPAWRAWRVLRPLATPGSTFSLLDIATGSGRVPLRIWQLARSRGINLRLTLTDVRDDMLRLAGSLSTQCGANARISRLDALSAPFAGTFDFVTANLFTHHLADEQVAVVLNRMMNAARIALVVNDLTRRPFSLFAVNVAARLVSRCPVVHADGDLSVRAAFTPEELRSIAERAGLKSARIRPAGPCRFMLVWQRNAS